MEYLIRFIQIHETFRQPETEALGEYHDLHFEWISYSDEHVKAAIDTPKSPFAIIRFKQTANSDEAARILASRSILIHAIYELWGQGGDYAALHQDIRTRSHHLWDQHREQSFRFTYDGFQGSRCQTEQTEIMESFAYMDFRGPIRMKKADNHFTIFEESKLNALTPHRLLFGKLVAESGRKAIAKYNLKKRKYIATTSMDAELSLITANIALAGPGKIAYDPFVGTGSFPLACAHFGSAVFGSDMDGRSIRGKKGRNVRSNFEQYGTLSLYLDGFTADLTQSPLRNNQRYLDAIVCDPPYGVREGLKVLGSTKEALQHEVILPSGIPAHLGEGYIPPKRPYSFLRMLDDILDFGGRLLVDNGRLCMWMPVAGAVDEEETGELEPEPDAEQAQAEYAIPQHPTLELVSVSRQDFTKWSRRLLSYRRLPDCKVDDVELKAYQLQRLELQTNGSIEKSTASELNGFRKRYFAGFKSRAEVEAYRQRS